MKGGYMSIEFTFIFVLALMVGAFAIVIENTIIAGIILAIVSGLFYVFSPELNWLFSGIAFFLFIFHILRKSHQKIKSKYRINT